MKADPVANPCPECPFNRTVKPGTLGGSSPVTYIGQLHGPFFIACHMHLDFADPTWRERVKYIERPQCAGAAIFRANLGVDVTMPDGIAKLPADRERVFATGSEFVAYHAPETTWPAHGPKMADDPTFIEECVRDQIERARRGEKP